MEIIIADNSIIIYERLKSMISEANSTAIIYHAKTHIEAMELIIKKKPAVAILDSKLLWKSPVNLLKEIKDVNEKMVVIILTMRIEALSKEKYSGADFYLDKFYEFEKITGIINNSSRI